MTSRLLVIAGTVLAAVVSLSVGGGEQRAPILRATAGGDMQLESSHDGVAVLTASRLRPGDSAEGTLTLTNRAPGPQHLTLRMRDLADTPGPGGGELSGWVDLRIERGADVVYDGKLADFSTLDLGDLATGSTAPFRFVVTLPEQGPAVDDAYAGGTVEMAWAWRGDAEGDPEPPGAPPGDPPAEPPPAVEPPRETAPPAEDVEPSGRTEEAPAVDDLEGPPSTRPSAVRLWLGGRSAQPLGSGLNLSAACRPGCTLRAAAKVRVGRRWRTLGRRSLGTLAGTGRPDPLTFRLSALQQRSLRATLKRLGALTVRIQVTAIAPDHRAVTKLRTLRLQP